VDWTGLTLGLTIVCSHPGSDHCNWQLILLLCVPVGEVAWPGLLAPAGVLPSMWIDKSLEDFCS
jgi:hypothetical protein